MLKALCRFLLIMIAALMVLTSCGHANVIRLGFAGSLSGANSDLGVSGRNGVKLAVDEINKAGGINGRLIELTVKDDKNNKETALAVDEAFYKEDVKLIIGHMTSDMGELTIPYMNEKKMLMLSPTISADFLSDIDDCFFRMIPSSKLQSKTIAQNMIDNKKLSAAVLYDGSNLLFTESLKNEFISEYTDKGGQVVYEKQFVMDSVDADGILADIRASGAEAVFVISGADNVTFFSQYFYMNKFDIVFYLPAWAMTSDLLDHGGQSIEGACLVNFINVDNEKQTYLDFVDKYVQVFGSQPSFSSVFSYESVMVLAEAIRASNTTDPEQLIDYILTKKDFEGLQNPISFTSTGDIIRDSYVYTVQDGNFVILGDT